jgi:hypothetical protein
MHLVVEEDKYLKVEKGKYSEFLDFFFDLMFFYFIVGSVGKDA